MIINGVDLYVRYTPAMHDGPDMIRVLIADDHKLVRSGFRLMLTSLGGVEIVGETGDGREALELIRKQKPHVALLDITMPGLTGIEIANRIRTEQPETKIVILSMHVNTEYVARAVHAGVSGYLLKSSDPMELELALRTALSGGTYLSPGIRKDTLLDYVRRVEAADNLLDQLTPRQREILQLIAEGRNTKTIAAELGISAKTVETHRTGLMERLGVHDVPGLVRYAIRAGLIEAE